jgi:hypothetical protein
MLGHELRCCWSGSCFKEVWEVYLTTSRRNNSTSCEKLSRISSNAAAPTFFEGYD